jgi:two-component system chemotaxis sensor kinase CheA
MVRSGGMHYAIPLAPIDEILKISRGEVDDVVGRKVLLIRGKVHPFYDLQSVLGNAGNGDNEYRYAVVVAIGESRFCLAVDGLLGQEEIVIKAVDGVDSAAAHILGVTITGDGKVVLILDLASISRDVAGLIKKT